MTPESVYVAINESSSLFDAFQTQLGNFFVASVKSDRKAMDKARQAAQDLLDGYFDKVATCHEAIRVLS